MNINKADIGARIKIALESAKVSQRDLSRALNITEPSVSAYTSGKSEPSAIGFATISKLTGVSIDWLITGKERPPKPELKSAGVYSLGEEDKNALTTAESLLKWRGLDDRFAVTEIASPVEIKTQLNNEESRLLNAFRQLDRKIQESILIQVEMTAEGLRKSAKKEPLDVDLTEAV